MTLTTRQIAFLKLLLIIAAAMIFMGAGCEQWETQPQSAPTADAAEHLRRQSLIKSELGLDNSGAPVDPPVNFTRPVSSPEPVRSQIIR